MKKIMMILLLLLSFNITVVPCEAKIHRGQTKDGVTYQYNTKTKTLTMSGKTIKGNLNNPSKAPWQKWRWKVKKIVLKKGVQNVSDAAFSGFGKNGKMVKLVLPDTLKKIGKKAFKSIEVKKLVLPDSVTKIGEFAFSYDPYDGPIEKIKLPKKLKKIGVCAFSYQSIKELIIPENVTSIEKWAFEGCVDLKTVYIKSKKIKKIGRDVFKNVPRELVVYVPKDKISEYRRMLWKGNAFNIEPLPDK